MEGMLVSGKRRKQTNILSERDSVDFKIAFQSMFVLLFSYVDRLSILSLLALSRRVWNIVEGRYRDCRGVRSAMQISSNRVIALRFRFQSFPDKTRECRKGSMTLYVASPTANNSSFPCKGQQQRQRQQYQQRNCSHRSQRLTVFYTSFRQQIRNRITKWFGF